MQNKQRPTYFNQNGENCWFLCEFEGSVYNLHTNISKLGVQVTICTENTTFTHVFAFGQLIMRPNPPSQPFHV